MDKEKIKELIEYLEGTNTKKLRIKEKDFEIEIEQHAPAMLQPIMTAELTGYNPMKTEMVQHRESATPARAEVEEGSGGSYITSPMVGTFYAASSPESPPFIKEGAQVKKGDVVCIVEAMKVMNEVKAESEGVVQKVLVENGHPVEFGTKLFQIIT